MQYINADEGWHETIAKILQRGDEVSPRGKLTKEIRNHVVEIDMRYPVVCHPGRKLNYQFMAAEAYWILTGDDLVNGIAPYNKHIAQFSDNGVDFAGAYGPRIWDQLDWVVNKLYEDPDTRQAVMTIWQPKPQPSKDIPCTVSAIFNIRENYLHLTVTMRSSDAWLGLPYDLFNFSMLGHRVAGAINLRRAIDGRPKVGVGDLTLLAVSSHLYDHNMDAAMTCCLDNKMPIPGIVPDNLGAEPLALMGRLEALRHTKKGDPLRWWETP